MPRAVPMPAEERRAAIIAATEPLLLTHGHQVSTREIAAAAQVAEGTLFRVFASKEELIEATVGEIIDPQRTIDQLSTIDGELDLVSRLTAAATVLQEQMERVTALFGMLRSPRMHKAPTPEFIANRRNQNQLLLDALTALIEPDRDQLRTSPQEVARLLQALSVSTRHPIFTHTFDNGTPAQLVDLLLHGVHRHHDHAALSPTPSPADPRSASESSPGAR